MTHDAFLQAIIENPEDDAPPPRLHDMGDEGARALALSPHLRNLTKLSVGGNRIGPEGAAALAAAPPLSSLTFLG